jgi:tetratricopeptide (TPR) repeat protein
MEEGERRADEALNDEAYEQFKRAVAADSAFAYGYVKLAEYSLSFDEGKRNRQRAEAYLSTASETERLLIDIERKAFARDNMGALELSQQLVAKHPNNPRAHWELANRQFGAGQVNEGRASMKKAVDLAPQYGAMHLYYGNTFLSEPKDLAKAEAEILAGQKLWPNQPVSYDLLGDLRRQQNRLDEAAAAYTRQIELDPGQAEGHSQRGHVYTFLGQYDKARADYTNAMRLSKANGPVTYAVFRSLVSVYAGEPDRAIAELEQLAQAIDGMGLPEPEGSKAYALSNVLVIATHTRKFDVAERALGRVDSLRQKLKGRSGSAEINRGLDLAAAFDHGTLAAFKGDYPLAKRKAAEFMKLTANERTPTKNRRAHALLGFVALFEKRYDDAIKEFEQGDPDSIYQTYHRALALEGAGRAAEAKALFKEVAGHGFNAPGYDLVREDAIARAR